MDNAPFDQILKNTKRRKNMVDFKSVLPGVKIVKEDETGKEE